MYKARNGFILHNSMTPGGWRIQQAHDIVNALLVYPEFQTVAAGFIWEALEQSCGDRKEYADIEDLRQHITANYI